MELNNRIKIRISDNNCIIQTEKNLPDAASNSVSFNISKSDDEECLNSNIEISMQSIFLSDKKKSFESSTLQVTPRRSAKQLLSKQDINKPSLKELSLGPNTLTEAITSGINTIKNTTASSSKIASNPTMIIKSTSNTNTVTNNTSPFNSLGNTYSNNYSGSTSFVEKNLGLGINKIVLKPKNDLSIRKHVIDNFINKIVKQRSQSTRTGRIAPNRLSTSISHKVFQCNPSVMSTSTLSKDYNCSSHKKINSNSSYRTSNKNGIERLSIAKENKKKIQFTPSSFTLVKKQTASTTSLHKGSFSLVNFIMGSCFIKNTSVKKNGCPNTCNSSRNHINLPLNKKLRTSPSPPKMIPLKSPLLTKHNSINSQKTVDDNSNKKKKEVQTISNFSKYVKKSKQNYNINTKVNCNNNDNDNTVVQPQKQLQIQQQTKYHQQHLQQSKQPKLNKINNQLNTHKNHSSSSLITINTSSYKTTHYQRKILINTVQKAVGDYNNNFNHI